MKRFLLINLAISALLMSLAIPPRTPDSTWDKGTPLDIYEQEDFNSH